jgi:hypothetical protein
MLGPRCRLHSKALFEAALITMATDVLPCFFRTILSAAYKFTTLYHTIVCIMTLEDTGSKIYSLLLVSKLVESILTLPQFCKDNNTETCSIKMVDINERIE